MSITSTMISDQIKDFSINEDLINKNQSSNIDIKMLQRYGIGILQDVGLGVRELPDDTHQRILSSVFILKNKRHKNYIKRVYNRQKLYNKRKKRGLI